MGELLKRINSTLPKIQQESIRNLLLKYQNVSGILDILFLKLERLAQAEARDTSQVYDLLNIADNIKSQCHELITFFLSDENDFLMNELVPLMHNVHYIASPDDTLELSDKNDCIQKCQRLAEKYERFISSACTTFNVPSPAQNTASASHSLV